MRRAETVPRTEQGAPGKPRPAVFAFDCPGPRLLRDFTKERLGFSFQEQNPLMSTSSSPPEGSLPMLSSEPAPSSPRPWASARARPLADTSTLTRSALPSGKRGHFYFAQMGTFLLCRDTGIWRLRAPEWMEYNEGTRAEDRATQGCDPSAESRAGMAGRLRPPQRSDFRLRCP